MAARRTDRTNRTRSKDEPIEAAYTVKGTAHTPLKPEEWQPLFLDHYADCGSIVEAAKRTGIGRRTVYDAKENDPQFAAEMNRARLLYGELLIGEINRRAVEGTEEIEETVTVGFDGEVSAKEKRVRKFSDTLLIFQTKAILPAMYGDRLTVNQVNVREEIAEMAEAENVPAGIVELEVRRIARAQLERQKAAGKLTEGRQGHG